MKEKWIDAYMDVAERFAQLSSATKLKVGAVVVKDHRIISIGYNGTPAGWDNECEEDRLEEVEGVAESDQHPSDRVWYRVVRKTKPEVIHAEANAIMKLAQSNEAGEGSTLFCTHAPCIDCAKMIYGSGIKHVFCRHHYKNDHGIEFLKRCGIEVEFTD
jgi:dCMP deaminase